MKKELAFKDELFGTAVSYMDKNTDVINLEVQSN